MVWGMPRLAPVTFALAFLLLAACESRPPIDRAQAISLADDLQRRENRWVGDPIEVLDPAPPDAGGHRWWQLRYPDAPGASAYDRLILVDSESGWARWPYPGYAVRAPAIAPKVSSEHPLTVQEGSCVLMVVEPAVVDRDRAALLEREAARLNALGRETGLYPLFSVRVDRSGRTALVYGWQGDRGIVRDERVVDWIAAHSSYGRGTWVDLDGG
jgi:hypothetical protein